jgi:hypothetical protein
LAATKGEAKLAIAIADWEKLIASFSIGNPSLRSGPIVNRQFGWNHDVKEAGNASQS